VPSADNSGEVSRQFVLNLKAAIGDQSNRAVERLTGVNDDTIASILEGDSWPDLDIIARLERGFGVVLWPGLVDLDE
jgi:hypothetical protein